MKFKLYDIVAIRLLCIVDVFLLGIVIFCGIAFPPFIDLPTFIFGGLLIASILLQFGIYIFSKSYILFDKNGFEIVTKNKISKVPWDDVSELCFDDISYILVLRHNTMEFWYKEGNSMISFEKKYGPIKISKKEYLELCELRKQDR